MKRRAWRWLALSSALFGQTLAAATRPHYGGTLRLELTPDSRRLEALIAEPLVRADSAGEMQPVLALTWQHDAEKKRWRFTLRPRVSFHDGTPFTAGSAVAPVKAALGGDVTVAATGLVLLIQAERALPDLLEQLARPGAAIAHTSVDKVPIGTGPFRVARWEQGRVVSLEAYEDYWGGRPFLDAVAIGAAPRQGPYSLNAADVVELPLGVPRRALPERMRSWVSAPVELFAIEASGVPPAVREALSLSVDRAAIVNVLTQKRGEVAGSLLPRWLSGYSFLFPVATDVARAKQLLSTGAPGTVTLAYPAGDVLARAIAERVAVNARDAGLNIQVSAQAGMLRLVRLPVHSAQALAELGEAPRGTDAQALYEAERALLTDHKIIPLVHVPELWGLHPRVHNWNGLLHLDSVWVDP